MKHAYVSVVLPLSELPSSNALSDLDGALAEQTRAHEIVLVTPYAEGSADYNGLVLKGPLTTVTTNMRATMDSATVAGLARAVGDFIVEWHGSVEQLNSERLESLLAPTDADSELVEWTAVETSVISKAFYRLVNILRPRDVPIRKTIARVYSRHAVGQVLAATPFEPQLNILAAELSVTRTVQSSDLRTRQRRSVFQRLAEGLNLLSKGTRFGTAIPLSLAAVSALFGIGAAIYALLILFLRGQTPEGWTTLMVVAGLGQAAILAMLGLTWTRIDALARGLSRYRDATAAVEVWAPRAEQSRPARDSQ